MRLSGWIGLAVGLLLGGLSVGLIVHRPLPVTGWTLVCQQAPYQRITAPVLRGLNQAGLQVGLRGWQPTAEWVNDQCEVMKQTRHQDG